MTPFVALAEHIAQELSKAYPSIAKDIWIDRVSWRSNDQNPVYISKVTIQIGKLIRTTVYFYDDIVRVVNINGGDRQAFDHDYQDPDLIQKIINAVRYIELSRYDP